MSQARFRTGSWEVSPLKTQIRDGEIERRLEPKVMDVLCRLAEAEGEVVSKQDLLETVWGDTHVTESVLTRAVSLLRSALGDESASPRYIQTVPRRGYRLMTPVESPSDDSILEPVPSPPSGPERRNLTVLFCDFVDAARLAASVDTEEWHDVATRCRETLAPVVSHYGGHLSHYMSDGTLVLFGYPNTHENDAERAVLAALELRETFGRVADELRGEGKPCPSIRVGIHTGAAVVNDVGADQPIAPGTTVDTATLLARGIDTDCVALSRETLRLVQGLFSVRPIGTVALGTLDPIEAHAVQHTSGVRSRLDAQTHPARFVGRAEELALLLDRWSKARNGQGQAILLSGEPGIGKSRLLQRLRSELATGPPHSWLECGGLPYLSGSSLAPVIELLGRILQAQAGAEEVPRRDRIHDALERHELAEPASLAALGGILGVPQDEAHNHGWFADAEAERRHGLAVLCEWFLRMGREQPLVLLVEDLQWLDPSTLDLLGELLAQVPTAPVLLVLTYRPEFSPPWPMPPEASPLVLPRLTESEARKMVDTGEAGSETPADVVDEILRRGDGIPLFLEELVSAIGHDAAGSSREIPPTLRDPLMARLDRLGPIKKLAQVCSCIGREFTRSLIEALAVVPEEELAAQLGAAVRAGLLYRRGSGKAASYTFRHALIRDAAYESLLARDRRKRHREIARALEAQFVELAASQPELVAHHLTEAEMPEEASIYWQRAGDAANRRAAHREAIGHLTRATEVLAPLPESREKARRELEVQMSLGVAYRAAKGLASLEAATAGRAAHSLCLKLGDAPELFAVLAGLRVFHTVRGEMEPALEAAQEMLTIAEQNGSAELSVQAHCALGVCLNLQGAFVASRDRYEKALQGCEPDDDGAASLRFGLDPNVQTRATLSMPLVALGYPDQALAGCEAALERARKISHPHSIGLALQALTNTRWLRGEVDAVRTLATETVAFSEEQSLPMWRASAEIFLGRALVQFGEAEEGLRLLEKGHADWGKTGARAYGTEYILGLSEAYGTVGRLDRAFNLLEQAENLRDEIDEQYAAASLETQRGKLHEAKSERQQAETSYRRSLEIAESQGALGRKPLAAVRLATLLHDDGRREEAQGLVRATYDALSEGFETPHVRALQALLETTR